MSRSLIKQLEGIRASVSYDDAIASAHTIGVAEAQVTAEGDLNVMRTLINDIIGLTNWYDTPSETIEELFNRPSPGTQTRVTLQQHGVAVAVTAARSLNVTAQSFGTLADEAGTGEGVLASVTKGDAIDEGGKNIVQVIDSTTGDPYETDGKRVFGYLVVDSIGTPTVQTIHWYTKTGAGAETAFTFVDTPTVVLFVRRRYTSVTVPEDYGISDVPVFHNIAEDANIGNRLYTEDNFVVDDETITASIDSLDAATEDGRLILGTAKGVDVFALGTNLFSSATLSAQSALNEIDNAILGTGSAQLVYAGANYITTTIDIEGGMLELDAAIKVNEDAIADASAVKKFEVGVGPITSGTAHTLPGSLAYTLATGDNLDVYLNGQLLVHGATEDYLEDTITTVKFNFTVAASANITYFARK